MNEVEEAVEKNPEKMSLHDLRVRRDEATMIHSKVLLALSFLDHKIAVKVLFVDEVANPLVKRIDFYDALIEKKESV